MDRRRFLAGTGLLAGALVLSPADALALGGEDAAHYGLAPDSGSDQTAALASALRAVDGKPLFLAPGTYRVNGLDLPEGARLVGAAGRTVLRQTGRESLARASGRRNLALSGLTLAGPGGREPEAPALLALAEIARLDLAHCDLVDAPGNAVDLERSGGRVANCRLAGAGAAGLFALDSAGLDIEANRVEDCADNGILVWASSAREDASLVRANRISRIGAASGGSGQYGNAVNVFRAGNVVVAQNVAADCAYSAVRINAGANCQVLGNNARAMGECAIFVEFSFDGAVVADNLVDGASKGVSITNYNEGGRLATCSGNLIRNVFQRPGDDPGGIAITAEADTAVTGNTVEAAADIGLLLGWGPYLRDVAASGNVVRGCPIGIAASVAEGAGAATITGNTVSGARRSAIVAMRWNDIVADLAETPDRFASITVRGNTVV